MYIYIVVMILYFLNNDNLMFKYILKLIFINNRGKCCWSVWFVFFCVFKILKRYCDVEI